MSKDNKIYYTPGPVEATLEGSSSGSGASDADLSKRVDELERKSVKIDQIGSSLDTVNAKKGQVLTAIYDNMPGFSYTWQDAPSGGSSGDIVMRSYTPNITVPSINGQSYSNGALRPFLFEIAFSSSGTTNITHISVNLIGYYVGNNNIYSIQMIDGQHTEYNVGTYPDFGKVLITTDSTYINFSDSTLGSVSGAGGRILLIGLDAKGKEFINNIINVPEAKLVPLN